MIINNLNVITISGRPAKIQTPLIVNPDAGLTRTVTTQRLKTVARRGTKEVKGRGSIQLSLFSLCYPADPLPFPGTAPLEEGLGAFVTKALDREIYYISICDKLHPEAVQRLRFTATPC
jgi:hypothetical protein